MMAALRARDLGLDVLVIEKAHKYGGTSATSGGVLWIPNHGLSGSDDSREESLRYLAAVTKDPIRRDRKRDVSGKSESVRVDLDGSRIIKKKKNRKERNNQTNKEN